jgi:hypothetical protein
MIQEETKGMTVEERTAYKHAVAVRFLAPNNSQPSAATITQ